MKHLAKLISLLVVMGSIASASAHTYFFGLTDINVNPKTQQAEIIHHYTSHDLEHLVLELYGVELTDDDSAFEKALKDYMAKNFSLNKNDAAIELIWIGYEISSGKLSIFQESKNTVSLNQIVITHTVLTKFYTNQVNTVNYQQDASKGSLTFDHLKQSARISIN